MIYPAGRRARQAPFAVTFVDHPLLRSHRFALFHSQVELVRQVFLYETCPDVLLVDETMAPLDPTSKSLVMQELKKFCRESVLIVIYHSDIHLEQDDGPNGQAHAKDCIPSTNFFDYNVHVEHGILHLRDVC